MYTAYASVVVLTLFGLPHCLCPAPPRQSELDYLEQLGADIDVHARFGGASHGGHEEDEHTLSMEVRSLARACMQSALPPGQLPATCLLTSGMPITD